METFSELLAICSESSPVTVNESLRLEIEGYMFDRTVKYRNRISQICKSSN